MCGCFFFQVVIGQTDVIRQAVKCLARDEPQEREESVKLLHELSKSYFMCEKIGATNGAILFLVGMTSSNSENMAAGNVAEQVLTNLSKCDKNVMQMAENGRVQPLLDRLTHGPLSAPHNHNQSRLGIQSPKGYV